MAPVLYSFRRCPYAIRARLALAAAGLLPGRDLELREVRLQAKPPELLEASAKGTVPVLVGLAGATGEGGRSGVLDQSLAIMRWALAQRDPHDWLADWSVAEQSQMEALIAENDGPFKHHLDRFKYAGRFGAEGEAAREQQRTAGLEILRGWCRRLEAGSWLLGGRPSLADWALLPFVRQFRQADPARFDTDANLAALQAWLSRFLVSPELAAVLEPPWAHRSVWRSPRWLYHLALRQEWLAAQADGLYRRSSRGLALEAVGFIHASYSHQVPATYARFYADADDAVLLLTIDPQRLEQADVAVRPEPAPGSLELFPHLYGPLPREAVLLVEPYRP